jgi:hypothetical protein
MGKSKVQSADRDGRVGKQVLNRDFKYSNAVVATRISILVEKGRSNIRIILKILKTRYG